MKRLFLLPLAGLLLIPASVSAASVEVPVEDYYSRQTVKLFATLANAEFHERNRVLFPNNGFRNQFTGYHAGTDIDFHDPADLTRPVAVKAVADGEVVHVGSIAGYGGLVILRHTTPESVTSLYGHVRLSNAAVKVGQRVRAGERLAYLGDQFSADTSGARKHLHFGIHKGAALDVEGHEPSIEQLNAEWYNPNDWLARYGAGPKAAPTTTIPVASTTPRPAPTQPKSFFDNIIDFLKDLFS